MVFNSAFEVFSDYKICVVVLECGPNFALHHKFFGQPDDGLHTGPKHVVVYYIYCY